MKMIAMAAAMVLAAGTAGASTLTIDPRQPESFSFGWEDGLGDIDFINGEAGSDFALSVGTTTLVYFAISGYKASASNETASFSAKIDGQIEPWTVSGLSAPSGEPDFYSAYFYKALNPGLYTISLSVESLTDGQLSVTANGVVSYSTISAVPLPASSLLMLMALGAIGVAGRRMRRTA